MSFTGLAAIAGHHDRNRGRASRSEHVQSDGGLPASPLASELLPADMRLRAGSPAENAGQVLPNINDGFAGAAPDVGAFDSGRRTGVRTGRPAIPPQVTAVRVHDGSGQRSMVASLTVAFSGPGDARLGGVRTHAAGTAARPCR